MKKILYPLTCTILVIAACGTSNIAPTLDPNGLQTVIVSTALAAQNQTQTATIPTGTPIPTSILYPTAQPTWPPLPTQDSYAIELPLKLTAYHNAFQIVLEINTEATMNMELLSIPAWRNRMEGALANLDSAARDLGTLSSNNPKYQNIETDIKCISSETFNNDTRIPSMDRTY